MFFQRIINLAMRGATLGSKLFLTLFLAKFFSLSDLGSYGLVLVTVTYCNEIVGGQFYSYTSRLLIKTDEGHSWIIQQQLMFHLIMYIIMIPVALYLIVSGIIPFGLFVMIFPIMLTEHIAQEQQRWLIALSKPLEANFLLFVRSGIWPIVLIVLCFFMPELRTLRTLFYTWLVGSAISCCLGFYFVKREVVVKRINRIDFNWIKKGVLTSLPFLYSSLIAQGVYTIDRYLVDLIGGDEVLGAYTLFFSVVSALIPCADACIFHFNYPEQVKSWQEKKYTTFLSLAKKMYLHNFLLVLCFIPVCYIFLYGYVTWLNKSVILENMSLLPTLLAAFALQVIGHVSHYQLYSVGADRSIIINQSIGALVFASTVVALSSLLKVQVIPLGLILMNITVLILNRLSVKNEMTKIVLA